MRVLVVVLALIVLASVAEPYWRETALIAACAIALTGLREIKEFVMRVVDQYRKI